MAEAQGLDHLRLDRRHVLVGLVGAKRGANDGAGSAAALGLTHQLGDGLRDIVRVRGVLALEHRTEGLDHGRGNFPDRAIGLRHFGVGGRVKGGEKVSRVSPGCTSTTSTPSCETSYRRLSLSASTANLLAP